MSAQRYSPRVVIKVCGITPRMLDYWITTGIICPTDKLAKEKRQLFYFGYDDIVLIKVVKTMRDAGLPLQRIRDALAALQQKGKAWRCAWLVTDGKNPFVPTNDPRFVESLAKGESGQLAFSFVAVRELKQRVRLELKDHKAAKSAVLKQA